MKFTFIKINFFLVPVAARIHILRLGYIYCVLDTYTASWIHILRLGYIYYVLDTYTTSYFGVPLYLHS